MKIISYKESDFEYLIKTYNPLMMRNSEGNLEVFQNKKNCYYEFLRRFYQHHYKGYCEPVLWIYDNYGLEFVDCQRVFALWRSKFRCPDEPFLINWNDDKSIKEYLMYFVKGCHYLCDTPFDEANFILAFDLFCQTFKNLRNESNT